jgi:hypothetical protein
MKKYIVSEQSIEKILVYLMRTKDSEGKYIYTGDTCRFIREELIKEILDFEPLKEGLEKIAHWAHMSHTAEYVDVNAMVKGIEEKAEDLIREHLASDE